MLLLGDAIKHRYFYAGFLFLLASYTDYLDGKFARKYNIITSFGQIMDPLSDKILVVSMFICFVASGLVPALAVVLIVAREFIVTSVRLIVLQNNGEVVSANFFGKLKTFTQMMSIIWILFSEVYIDLWKNHFIFSPPDVNMINFIQNFLIWISVILSYISGVIYLYSNRKCISLDI